jgi:hypothetical protein
MFETSLEIAYRDEVKKLNGIINEKEYKIAKLERDCDMLKLGNELHIEKAKNELRKEMEKSLIESDLKRVEAVAKLEAYEKMDTKEERKYITQMLEKAITGLAAQKVQIVK